MTVGKLEHKNSFILESQHSFAALQEPICVAAAAPPKPVEKMEFDLNRIPPEMWEEIFKKLKNPEDLVSVLNTCQYWNDMVYPSRSHWMFEMIFPSILSHLSKSDILQCRRVSKRWCSGVDNFLENNSFNRPALQTKKLKPSQKSSLKRRPRYTTDLPVTLQEKGLTYNRFWGMDKMQKMLNEASSHSRCPIIGKSASIVISVRSRLQLATITKFFQVFGHQIWFLNIAIISRYSDPVEMLSIILNLLVHCPNLKMLDINDENGHRVEHTLDSDDKLEAKSSLSNYLENGVTKEMRRSLPKVETLRVKMNQVCTVKFQEILLSLFSSDNLQSLSLDPMVALQTGLPLRNLIHLNASLYSEDALTSIAPLASRVQSLELQVCGPLKTTAVFDTVSYSKSTLRNLGLSIKSNLHKTYPSADLSSVFAPLMQTNALKRFPHLCNVSVEGWIPSLNFLNGIGDSLESMQIATRSPVPYYAIPSSSSSEEPKEIIDLLQVVESTPAATQYQIYQSNVWNMFPRLQALTVNTSQGREEEERKYTRDVRDRFQQ